MNPESWLARLAPVFDAAPNPEQARQNASLVLTATADSLADVPDERALTLGRVLFALCGIAPFFAKFIERHPHWLAALLDEDFDTPRGSEDLGRRLDEALAREAESEPELALRRFKYYELARLTIRDSCEAWVPLASSEITLLEISNLADVLLQRSLEIARAALEESCGPPRWRGANGETVELGFCVLGLGKLGSQELNYSSDVDLVYVHESPSVPLDTPGDEVSGPGSAGFAALPPLDYFTRLAQRFGRLVASTTSLRFLYRIDLDLRPQGAQGTLVVSDEGLAAYYEAWADTWERAAFMKARPVAGDLALGWRSIRKADPMIYRSGMDFAGVESIRAMKQKVEEAHRGRAEGLNIKVDAGGIRDVEFIAQAQQLLHGDKILQIRERSTLRSLEKLAEVGLLPADQAETLFAAYRFLRRVENRIQMEDERQNHIVPREGPALARLARSMGFVATQSAEAGSSDEASIAAFEAELSKCREAVQFLFEGASAIGGVERILDLLARNAPGLLSLATTRRMIESLAKQLAWRIDESADPERALNNLDRFVESIGSRRFYYELLLDRPELVPRLTALFASSKYLSNYLARYPGLIERIFANPDILLLSREALSREFHATLASYGETLSHDLETEFDALRVFQHCQVLNVGLLDIAGEIERRAGEAGLTDIAEVCLERALAMAEKHLAEHLERVDGSAALLDESSFLVVGLGKLGSRELTYGSDLDLIFLFDLPQRDLSEHTSERGAQAQAHYVTLTQRLISFLQTPTAEGFCYEIDARLRPSGNQGALVTSIANLRRYHEESAAVWERQALLRARPVAGDPALAEAFEAERRRILELPLPDDLAAEIDAVRQRMETELASETRLRRNFKTGRGGLLDVETITQFLQLNHGTDHPALLDVMRTEAHIERMSSLGLLEPEDAAALAGGWEFLQRLSSRLRVVENRSITDLDSERSDLENLARRLGYGAEGRERNARRGLLADYQRHTDRIREVYERVVRAGSGRAD